MVFKLEPYIGKRFFRWEVIGQAATRGNAIYLTCKCDCGTVREVRKVVLEHKDSLSCGCWAKEVASRVHTKLIKNNLARQRGTIEHFQCDRWNGIKNRTVNGNEARYKQHQWYYDNGIEVRMTKEEFYKWCRQNKDLIMSLYAEGKVPSVNRIDPTKHYSLDNIEILDLNINNEMGLQVARINGIPAASKAKEKKCLVTDKEGIQVGFYSMKEVKKFYGLVTKNLHRNAIGNVIKYKGFTIEILGTDKSLNL